MLTSLVPVLFTFYIQGVLKLEKSNSGAKGLKDSVYSTVLTVLLLLNPPLIEGHLLCMHFILAIN